MKTCKSRWGVDLLEFDWNEVMTVRRWRWGAPQRNTRYVDARHARNFPTNVHKRETIICARRVRQSGEPRLQNHTNAFKHNFGDIIARVRSEERRVGKECRS